MHLSSLLSVFLCSSGAWSSILQSRAAACKADNCARAVTGTTSTKVPLATRRADCAKLLTQTVTPATVTSTNTVTVTSPTTVSLTTTTFQTTQVTVTNTVTASSPAVAVGRRSGSGIEQRAAKVVSSGVPAYASACSSAARYSSACSCFGFSATTTTVAAPTTYTTVTLTATPTVTVVASTQTYPVTVTTTILTTVTPPATATCPATGQGSGFTCGSSLPVTVNAVIQILDAATSSVLGYLNNDPSQSGGYMYNEDVLANALVVSVTYTSTDCSSLSGLALTLQNSQNTDPAFGTYLGLIGGSGGYAQMGPGRPDYAYTGQTSYVPPNSTPQTVPTGATALGYDGPAEASIWNLDPACGTLTATWTNQDSSQIITTDFLDYALCPNGCILQSGDQNAFQQTFPGEQLQTITLKLIPQTTTL